VTNHADQPSEVEARSFADLAADAEVVRRRLDLREPTVSLPDQHSIVLSDSDIPDGALALVAGLDVYGD
jgi:hypothetical protein